LQSENQSLPGVGARWIACKERTLDTVLPTHSRSLARIESC